MAKTVSKIPLTPIERKRASEEEIKKGLELLARQRHTAERVKAGELSGTTYKKRADMTPEELKEAKRRNAVYSARNVLTLKKAKDAGITVTEAEIDKYLEGK